MALAEPSAETESLQQEPAMPRSRTIESTSRPASSSSSSKQEKVADRQAAQRREFRAHLQALEFLRGVDVQESGWGEWQDTVAAFNAR
ncbi:hypothetical protein DBR42_19175 [Pelomonas sp. HMWF004]|nr:hypothetical protein DBR42_19175 [Pelomonas sp. HMWF004]